MSQRRTDPARSMYLLHARVMIKSATQRANTRVIHYSSSTSNADKLRTNVSTHQHNELISSYLAFTRMVVIFLAVVLDVLEFVVVHLAVAGRPPAGAPMGC